jgi:lipoate---protein ligase
MQYLDLTLPTPEDNLALDEALLLEAEAGGPEILRVWEWPAPVVVLGAGCRIAEDVEEETCRADGIPVLRRSSGGGTILWGSGCLLYSLVLRYDHSPALREIRTSYEWILDLVMAGIGLPGLAQRGISDLTLDGLKFSGNAQQRKANTLLHHGTLLYNFHLPLVPQYLRQPPRQPDYRNDRTHLDFLTNLPREESQLKNGLKLIWQAGETVQSIPFQRVSSLRADRYDRDDWHRRR